LIYEGNCLAAKSNGKDFADKILKLIDDDVLRKNIGDRAKESAINNIQSKEQYLDNFIYNMKLLIITQKVDKDDSILGFFHRWIEEFAKNVESLIVICLEEGVHDLPKNVKVLSLGKDTGAGKIKRLLNFYKYIWVYRKEYDAVFVHMNQIYIILGGLLWRGLKKKMSLWYAHGKVSFSLRLAEKITNIVFTSTYTGFNIRSNKKKIVGQVIDVKHFQSLENIKKDYNSVVTVGRISNIKNIEVIIDLISKTDNFKLKVIGAPVQDKDFEYAQKIYLDVQNKGLSDRVSFLGPVSQENLPDILNKSHILINLSKTNSLDKAILEALACGLQVVTTNIAAKDLLGVHFISRYSIEEDNGVIIEKIKELSKKGLNEEGVDFVIKNHSVQSLIPKIINLIQK